MDRQFDANIHFITKQRIKYLDKIVYKRPTSLFRLGVSYLCVGRHVYQTSIESKERQRIFGAETKLRIVKNQQDWSIDTAATPVVVVVDLVV